MEQPDWDAEMSLFRKRLQKPNQLETLRKIEAEASVGKVLFAGDGIAIVEGLNNDAPVGTSLAFVGGAMGVLLWRRSDNICYALLLGSSAGVAIGDAVVCQIRAILQVVDEALGPTTKRDFEIAVVPAGDGLAGQVVDFLGRPPGTQQQLGAGERMPLFAEQPRLEDREPISEPLVTGVKSVDALTPLGRGQALLVTGARGAGKSALVTDALLGQRRTCVRCVYASVGQSQAEQDLLVRTLQVKGAMGATTVVAAPAGASLGQAVATLAAALALGERTRDAGGHALVVLDDISALVEMWERIAAALATLGPGAAADLGDGPAAPADPSDPEALVEYEGMLVSAAAAQRRRFFSSFIQRSAKLHRGKRGGSLTLLAVLPGAPARGEPPPAPDPERYRSLTPQQRDKLLAALRTRSARPSPAPSPGCVRTEVVEEFMSIADGQVVLICEGEGPPAVDPQASVSRIGARAYPPALATLAPQLRFELAQAVDAARFAHSQADPVVARKAAFAARVRAAFAQRPGHPVALEEQVAILYALQRPELANVRPEVVPGRLNLFVQRLRSCHPAVLREISATQQLTPAAEVVLGEALAATCAAFSPAA